jgi:hypothetical protein
MDVVINASGSEDPALARCAASQGAAFVDVTASTDYVAALEQLVPSRPVLLSVGLSPGLTNLLAAAVHAAAPGPVDLVAMIGAGEHHGSAATEWSFRLLGRDFPDPATGQRVRNYSGPRTFDLPGFGRRRLYRVDFSDQHVLTRHLEAPVRTYFGLDSRLATAALALLTSVPGAARLARGAHLPGTERWLLLARGVRGETRWAYGEGQSLATAVMAAAAARAVVGLPPRVYHLHEVMTLDGVPRGRGIHLAP